MLRLATIAVAATLFRCSCSEPTLSIGATASDRADIPLVDNGSSERSLMVRDSGRLVRATVEVVVEHARPEELELMLTSPSGTNLALEGRLAEGCNFYRFAIPLIALQGEEAQGTWRLRVIDGKPGTLGRLLAWGLAFEALD